MSSDNFYFIDYHPKGGYAVEMCFASDYEEGESVKITDRCTRFDSLKEAEHYAFTEYSEYGVQYSDALEKDIK